MILRQIEEGEAIPQTTVYFPIDRTKPESVSSNHHGRIFRTPLYIYPLFEPIPIDEDGALKAAPPGNYAMGNRQVFSDEERIVVSRIVAAGVPQLIQQIETLAEQRNEANLRAEKAEAAIARLTPAPAPEWVAFNISRMDEPGIRYQYRNAGKPSLVVKIPSESIWVVGSFVGSQGITHTKQGRVREDIELSSDLLMSAPLPPKMKTLILAVSKTPTSGSSSHTTSAAFPTRPTWLTDEGYAGCFIATIQIPEVQP